MEYESGTKMKTQCLKTDRISRLPENIIESILSLIPIEDALRTSVLSKKWRYTWRNMPKLVFTDDMVKASSNCRCFELEKYKIVNAIFHVLLLHRGPTVIDFNCSVGDLRMKSEFAQIFSYLATGNKVKELSFANDKLSYKLPSCFFSVQELEHLDLLNCTLEPPLTFNGFSKLKSMKFCNVTVSAQMLQRFLSKCPLLEKIHLSLYDLEDFDFEARGNKFTFVDLFHCVPLIRSLDISEYYLKCLSGVGMPHKLPTSLIHLKHLVLEVCLMDQNEISSTLCILRSSPLLVNIKFEMCGNEKLPLQQTSTNFFEPEEYPDLKLDHLEILLIERFRSLPREMEFVKLIMAKSPMLKKLQITIVGGVSCGQILTKYLDPEAQAHSDLKFDHLEMLGIRMFGNLPLGIEFVKLVMAKSPVLKKVKLKLHRNVSVDEELKMFRDLVRQPLPRASPSAELIIKRP